jgi:hypothetical protein
MNVPEVAQRIRQAVFHELPTGAAWLRVRDGEETTLDTLLPPGISRPFGLIGGMRQTLRTGLGSVAESEVSLHLSVVSGDGESVPVSKETMPALVRALLNTARQREPDAGSLAEWAPRVLAAETEMIPQLGRPTPEEHAAGVRHAVWPVFAAVVA